ncbi:MAG: glycosyltransferase family 4 protein [Methanophagales archaeon]|nr:glycosyltransferase family 4 protein [Methanophagales archaeon]
MKILMIAPEPFFEPRGTPFSVFHRSKALGKLGHKIDLVTYHLGENVAIRNVEIHRIPNVPFIKHVAIGPSFTKIPLDIVLFFKSRYMLSKNKYNCIHVHEEAAFIGCIFKIIFGTLLIYDMHSSIPQQLINFNFTKNRFLIKIAVIAEKWIIKNSDVIIAICPHLGETVHDIDKNKKVVIIENTPLTDQHKTAIKEDVEKLKKELDIGDNKVILYTGTFEYYQGIDLLLKGIPQVITKINDVRYVLVGGEPEQINEAKDLANSLNINNYVLFTGKRPVTEMPAFMAIADVLVSPRTIGTNTPLKIYSYLKSGKPIVATNLLTHTQVLDETVSILTAPDPDAFAEGIVRLLTDDELRKKMGQKGMELANTKYTYDAFMRKTEQVYKYVETWIGGT